MTTALAYGIDFGTTNSAVAVAYSDGTTEVVPSPELVTPSMVYLHRNRNELSGEEAIRSYLNSATTRTRCRGCDLVSWVDGQPLSDCRQAKSNGYCLDSRLMSQLKSDLADADFGSTHSWARDFALEDLVAVVLRQLKRRADLHTGGSVDRVAIGHPVVFAGAANDRHKELQTLALQRLSAAAERAGFREIELVPESKAAVSLEGVGDGLLVCGDFGGGTFDASVVDVHANRGNILGLRGVPVGGEEFDAKIFDAFVRPVVGIDEAFRLSTGEQRHLPQAVQRQLRSLAGLKRLLTTNAAVGLASTYRGCGNDQALDFVDELLFGGQAFPFYRAIEQAKRELSHEEGTSIRFRSVSTSLDIPLSRAEFEDVIADDLSRVRFCLMDMLEDADVDPADVDYVARTGGSSQIPAFAQMLVDMFPNASMIESDPFTTVVEGLAEYSVEHWGHE